MDKTASKGMVIVEGRCPNCKGAVFYVGYDYVYKFWRCDKCRWIVQVKP